jgi:hypothetical protein
VQLLHVFVNCRLMHIGRKREYNMHLQELITGIFIPELRSAATIKKN